jgi:hypothetical protein
MSRIGFALPLAGVALVLVLWALPAPACCPAPPSGRPVVNADQTVIILWDAAAKTQHFIRKASFQSEADDFGFLVPSPSQPELSESGNDAFPYLQKLTEPEKKKVPYPSGGVRCGCIAAPGLKAPANAVRVLDEKLVAGFKATVLEASSAKDLVRWLVDNGYAYSAEVEAWARPYVEAGWKITALKVAKPEDGKTDKGVAASALRMSFKTDRPLFPYREPDPTTPAKAVGAKQRLLRIYFLADARYEGELTKEAPWTGKVAWCDRLRAEDRRQVLDLLKLPQTTGPAEWWLTEFEDNWPYRAAPADVSFRRAADQKPVKRPPIIEYTSSAWPADVMACAFAVALVGPPLLRRARRRCRNG